jgi:hypothetical protein
LFTKTLLPVMEKTASESGSDVRIVNVCATGMDSGPPQPTETGIFNRPPVGAKPTV